MRWCVLGNRSFYLGFDGRCVTKEMFWPTVGLANHIAESAENKVMLWLNDAVYGIGDTKWNLQGKYGKGMSFDWRFTHQILPLSVMVKDCIDPYSALWARSVTVDCYPSENVGLYFKQYYNLGENNIGECGFWDPLSHRLYHYKGKYWVAIGVTLDLARPPQKNQESGNHTRLGVVAKKRDGGVSVSSRTGEIFGRPIDHGLIESVYGIRLHSHEGTAIDRVKATYVLAFGRNKEETDTLLDTGLSLGFDGIYSRSAKYWAVKLDDQDSGSFYDTSVKIISTHCDNRGGILASCDTEIMYDYRDHYRYVWPRDASMCASSLAKSKMPDYAKRYLEFCSKAISNRGFFWQRYRPDGTRGSGWHNLGLPDGELPIQEDQIALSLITAIDYLEATGDLDFIKSIYSGFIEKAANFIQDYRSEDGYLVKPSFDLWEERRGIFSFTQAVSALSLACAAKIAWMLGKDNYIVFLKAGNQLIEGLCIKLSDEVRGFCRGLSVPGLDCDWTEDASLFAIPLFLNKMEALLDSFCGPEVLDGAKRLLRLLENRSLCTFRRLEKALMVLTQGNPNGIARYTGDWYWRPEGLHNAPGNPWFVTTGWYLMSGYVLKLLTKEQVDKWFGWFRAGSLECGILSEQISGLTGDPLSVAPLVWSHSTYVDIVNLIGKKSKAK